ncbi:CLCN3 [Cordylochernes scorpioides]|uniref:CLCN3 n=1 Tax=Cordylochernes scorpioides TaxID=51811 RepID=A0ABY6JVE4_9ARAC|nr:CLCN3 [Cordylochernes scorpioides]
MTRKIVKRSTFRRSLNLEATTDDPELLKRVITGGETCIYGFDSETTQQASEWRFKNEPRPKKAKKAPSKVKVMLKVFFDYQGIVHHEFQQQGSTITADSYLGVLRRLREAIRQKRPELWRSKSWILHHDNAPAHTALKISKFLQDHSTYVFPQPPYSPYLAPCDLLLFGKLKKKKKAKPGVGEVPSLGICFHRVLDTAAERNPLPRLSYFDSDEVIMAKRR